MANNSVGDYPPPNPAIGDFWTSTSEQGGGQLFVWNGTYWRSVSMPWDGITEGDFTWKNLRDKPESIVQLGESNKVDGGKFEENINGGSYRSSVKERI